MRSWTIGKKLYSVIGTLVALFLLSVGIVFYEVETVSATSEKTRAVVIRLEELADLSSTAERLLFIEKAAIVGAFTRDRANFDERVQEANTSLERIHEMTPKIMATLVIAENREELAAFEKGVNEWHDLFNEVASLADAGHPDEAQVVSKSKSRPLMEANVEHLKRMAERVKNQGEAAHEEDAASITRLLFTVSTILVIALGVGVVAWFIARSITRALQAVAAGLGEGAQQVAAASGQVSTSSQSLSQGSTEQAASLEESSASMEEMAAMTRQNAESARSAAALMTDVERQVSESNGALQAMVESMASIQDSSARVSKIIKTIDEIAFQTNILALNAAVEAARAGAAGMGFAVVADEVRNLAQRSAQAAKDTASLIEESGANAARGSEKVDQVAHAIVTITGSVTKVKSLVDEVSAASQQQTQGIDQVTQAINQMEKVTQGIAATAEESAAASEELSAQAETTLGIVHQLEAMVGRQASAAATHTPAGTQKRAATGPRTGTTGAPLTLLPTAKAAKRDPEQAIPFGETGTYGSF